MNLHANEITLTDTLLIFIPDFSISVNLVLIAPCESLSVKIL